MNNVRPICSGANTAENRDSGTSCYYESSGKTNRYSEYTMTKSRPISYSIYCCEDMHYLVLSYTELDQEYGRLKFKSLAAMTSSGRQTKLQKFKGRSI